MKAQKSQSVSLAEIKELLWAKFSHLTKEEILHLRTLLEYLAQTVIEKYLSWDLWFDRLRGKL